MHEPFTTCASTIHDNHSSSPLPKSSSCEIFDSHVLSIHSCVASVPHPDPSLTAPGFASSSDCIPLDNPPCPPVERTPSRACPLHAPLQSHPIEHTPMHAQAAKARISGLCARIEQQVERDGLTRDGYHEQQAERDGVTRVPSVPPRQGGLPQSTSPTRSCSPKLAATIPHAVPAQHTAPGSSGATKQRPSQTLD